MKKIVLLIFAVFMLCASAFAQNQRVTSTVTSEDGQPIVGVTVLVKGTGSNAAVTGTNGDYTLNNVPSGAVLVFQQLELVTQEIPVQNKTVINVVMASDVESIEEVTVVAYGTVRKEDLVGSVSQVKGAVIENSQASSVSKSLEGAVAGLQVISSSGQPGDDASIIIRGLGSINADRTAFIVVDGSPYTDKLSDINPADIESISVSKDAVSNSLYGARVANGVVMVTTKRGRTEVPQINVKATWGVTSRGVPEYALAKDPGEFYELAWYGIRNTQWASGVTLQEANLYASQTLLGNLGNYNSYRIPAGEYLVGTNGKLNPQTELLYYDPFYNSMFKNGFRQEYQASASGRTDRSDYYLSLGYLNEDSYIVGSDYDRLSMRVNVNTQLKRWLRVGTNIGYTRGKSNGLQEGSGLASNPFGVARSWAPIFPVYAYDWNGNLILDGEGNPIWDVGTGQTEGTSSRPVATNQNVIYNLHEDIRKTKNNTLTSRSYVEVRFLKDFTATVNYSYDYRGWNYTQFYSQGIGDGAAVNGRGYKYFYDTHTTTVNQLLAYDKTIGKHNISALAGHETYNYKYETLYGMKTQFYDPKNLDLNNGGDIGALQGYKIGHVIEGYFFKADYNFAHKYYISGAVRRDGSSRFHPDNRWGNFWSIGGSWRISQEDFMADTSGWLNDLKLRASYGTQGNESGLDYYGYMDQYEVSWNGSELGTTQVYYGNPNFTWESQNTFDIGLDFRLFNRLTGSIDYFYRVTDDMLFRKTLPMSDGRAYEWQNIGKMSNSGIEIELTYDIFRNREVDWSITFVGSHYKNKIIRLPEEYKENGMQNGSQMLKEGYDMYRWYTYEYAGYNPQTGKPMWYMDEEYVDANSVTQVRKVTTEEYNDATRYLLNKSAIPKFNGGISTYVAYKGFDLSINTAFQIGGWVLDSEFQGTMSQTPYISKNKEMWNTYNPETGTGKYPIWDANSSSSLTATSDLYLIKASYFNIRNITLGYTFPKRMMNKLGIEGIRIFVAADNVALFSERRGFDPRIAISGVQSSYGGYSQIRTISAGLNFNF